MWCGKRLPRFETDSIRVLERGTVVLQRARASLTVTLLLCVCLCLCCCAFHTHPLNGNHPHPCTQEFGGLPAWITKSSLYEEWVGDAEQLSTLAERASPCAVMLTLLN